MKTTDKSENIRERIFEVDQNYDGWRLDKFLVDRLPRLSRKRAAEIAKFGDVQLLRESNPPKKMKASTKLIAHDKVVLREHLPPEILIDERVSICFEDEDMIAVSKPPGMLVHEAGKIRLNTVVQYLRRQGFLEAGQVHRIDKETSGIVLCGKTREWISKLRKLFEKSEPDKVYRAIIRDPNQKWTVGETRTLDNPLGLIQGSLSGIIMGSGPLPSITQVRVLSALEVKGVPCKDVEVRIETGRQHQIRIHMAMYETPIAGDKLYVGGEQYFLDFADDPTLSSDHLLFPRHALHAWKLSFEHEEKGRVEIESQLPNDIWSEAI